MQAQFGSNWQNLVVAGQFSDHHLSNSSDEIELSSSNGGIIQDFTYRSWYPQTHGGGFSLTVRSATQATSLWDSGAGWEPSGAPNGTPGTAETTPIPLPGAVVINEVLANPTTPGGDMVELYNTTSQAVNVGGWYLSDSSTNLAMYQIAAGTSIAAGAYLVLTDAKNYGPGSGDPGAMIPFALNKYGFTVCLSSNVPALPGVAGGYQEEETYGATPRASRSAWSRPRRAERTSCSLQLPASGRRRAASIRPGQQPGLRFADRHDRVAIRSGRAHGGGIGRRLYRRRRLRVPRVVQSFQHCAIAERLLHGQRRGFHLRLDSRRRRQ